MYQAYSGYIYISICLCVHACACVCVSMCDVRTCTLTFNSFLKSTNFITTSFKDVGIMGYKYLSANRRNKLTVAEKQQLNGNDVIKLAGSGSLYLQQCVGPKSQDKNVSDHESQQEVRMYIYVELVTCNVIIDS